MLLFVLPVLNVLPAEDSWLHVSDFTLNRFGKFLAFAILALGLDLIWGYTGILSLGHGVFFGLGAYCMGMHLMLTIGTRERLRQRAAGFHGVESGQRTAVLLEAVLQLPGRGGRGSCWCRRSSRSCSDFSPSAAASAASTSRSSRRRSRSSAWLVFNRNETNLGRHQWPDRFQDASSASAQSSPGTQRASTSSRCLCLGGAYLLCRWIIESRAGQVLVAIRDSEQRVLFSGYSPANYKLFVFVVSAALAGLAGHALRAASRHHYAGANRCAAVARDGDLGRGGRTGDAGGSHRGRGRRELGRSILTNHFPELWPFFLGGLFVAVVLLFPGRSGRVWAEG